MVLNHHHCQEKKGLPSIHNANSLKCPKNKGKSCRNKRDKFNSSQRHTSGTSACQSSQKFAPAALAAMTNIEVSTSSWKKQFPLELQRSWKPLIKDYNDRKFYWCSTCKSFSTTHGDDHPTAKHVENYSQPSRPSARQALVFYAAAASSAPPETSVNIWNIAVPLVPKDS